MAVGPEAFGEDYLYFYETWLTPERDDSQTELVWRLLGRSRCGRPPEPAAHPRELPFDQVELFGYEGEPLTSDSRRVIAVARAPA
ncbi:MAG: hypothetical protein ACRDVG_05365 [Jatrophihabitantaceae bacterium]